MILASRLLCECVIYQHFFPIEQWKIRSSNGKKVNCKKSEKYEPKGSLWLFQKMLNLYVFPLFLSLSVLLKRWRVYFIEIAWWKDSKWLTITLNFMYCKWIPFNILSIFFHSARSQGRTDTHTHFLREKIEKINSISLNKFSINQNVISRTLRQKETKKWRSTWFHKKIYSTIFALKIIPWCV